VLPEKTSPTIARLAARQATCRSEHKPADRLWHVTAGSASYTLHTLQPEGLSAAARAPKTVQTFAVDRRVNLETIISCCARGVA